MWPRWQAWTRALSGWRCRLRGRRCLDVVEFDRDAIGRVYGIHLRCQRCLRRTPGMTWLAAERKASPHA